jgi:hypothetical protein
MKYKNYITSRNSDHTPKCDFNASLFFFFWSPAKSVFDREYIAANFHSIIVVEWHFSAMFPGFVETLIESTIFRKC